MGTFASRATFGKTPDVQDLEAGTVDSSEIVDVSIILLFLHLFLLDSYQENLAFFLEIPYWKSQLDLIYRKRDQT